jgi:dsDNA-specific endonuclease/ATPase MutS2
MAIAVVVKLVDTPALGAGSRKRMRVRVSPTALKLRPIQFMDKSEAQVFAAELGLEIPKLDLHGKYPEEIADEVRGFVLENYNFDKEMIRIIYGVGTGKMKEMVLKVLEREDIKSMIDTLEVKSGSCVIVFK